MKKCRECGKTFDVLWPEMYRYKRGTGTNYTYFCSWGCLRAYDRKTEGKEMARPAKKLVEVADKLPEEAAIQAEVPERITIKAKDIEKAIQKQGEIFGKEPLEVYAVKSRILADGIFCKEGNGMMLRGQSLGETNIYMMADRWIALSQEIQVALDQLGVKRHE